MGGNNTRTRTFDIDDYGTSYDPYSYPFGDIENYGSFYRLAEENETFNNPINSAILSTTKPRRRRIQPNNFSQYGSSYPPGFNPMSSSLMNKPRVRVVYMPQGVYNVLQNLFQQGAFTGLNGALPGVGVFAPGQSASQMYPGMSGLPPNPFQNGPGLFSQMPYGNPFGQQGPAVPLGPNCFSVSLPLSSAPSPFQMPILCPPPMIQPMVYPMVPQLPPMMPQFPMPPPPPPPSIGVPSFIPSVPCPSPIPFGPQPFSPMPNIPQQPFYPPNGIPFNNGLPAYAGFPHYAGYGGPNGWPCVPGSPYMNNGLFGPQGLAGYGGTYAPSGFLPTGQSMYPGFNPVTQNPYGFSPYNNAGAGGYVPQPYYGNYLGSPYPNYMYAGPNGYPIPAAYGGYGQEGYSGFNSGMSNPSGFFQSGLNNYSGQPYYPGYMPFCPPGFIAGPGQNFNPQQFFPPNNYPGYGPFNPSGFPSIQGQGPHGPAGLASYGYPGLMNFAGQPCIPGYNQPGYSPYYCPPGFVGGHGQNFYPQQNVLYNNYGGLSGYGGSGYYPGYGPLNPLGLPSVQGQGPYGPTGLGSYGYPGPMSVGGQPCFPGYNQPGYSPQYCPPGFVSSQGQYPAGQQGIPSNYNTPGYANNIGQPYYANQYPYNGYQGGNGMQQNPYSGFYPQGYLGFNPTNQNPSAFASNYQPGNPGYGLYNPQQIPNYPGFQGIPSNFQQPSGFTGIPSQPFYNYPGVNPNNPYANSSMSGFSQPGYGQFRPFPGRTGRITLVCCAIPE